MAKKGTKVSEETAQNVKALISLLGGTTKVAGLLGIKRQTLLSRSRANSFSVENALAINRLSSSRRDELKKHEDEIEVGLIVCGDSCRLGKGGEG